MQFSVFLDAISTLILRYEKKELHAVFGFLGRDYDATLRSLSEIDCCAVNKGWVVVGFACSSHSLDPTRSEC
jgi:hypothetical protein